MNFDGRKWCGNKVPEAGNLYMCGSPHLRGTEIAREIPFKGYFWGMVEAVNIGPMIMREAAWAAVVRMAGFYTGIVFRHFSPRARVEFIPRGTPMMEEGGLPSANDFIYVWFWAYGDRLYPIAKVHPWDDVWTMAKTFAGARLFLRDAPTVGGIRSAMTAEEMDRMGAIGSLEEAERAFRGLALGIRGEQPTRNADGARLLDAVQLQTTAQFLEPRLGNITRQRMTWAQTQPGQMPRATFTPIQTTAAHLDPTDQDDDDADEDEEP